MRIRTAILGCGQFAHRHAQILSNMKDEVELVAFCDRQESRAREYADLYSDGAGAVFTDQHALFEGAQFDLVMICLPPFAHTDEVELAAERGIHLLIEKPIALSSTQAWRMVRTAEKAGIKTQVGFMFRFGEAVEHLKNQIDSGEAGPLGLMSARYFCNSLHTPWWRDRSKSGGQLLEQVIHMFDLLRYLGGEVSSVYSRQDNIFHREQADYTIEDVSATVVNFRSSGLGVVYATNGAIPGKWINDYRVVTGRITADFKDANHAVFHLTDQEGIPEVSVDSERDFRKKQIEDLLRAIHTGSETRTPIREGAKTLDLVLAATESAESHQEKLLG